MLRRQICPPGFGLSSINMTSRADSAAVTAAAIPAGPPPMTATSTLVAEALLIATNLHSFTARRLATALMRFSVDGHATLKTRAHSAQRRTLLARDRDPTSAPRVQHRDSDTRSIRHTNRLPIHAHGNYAGCRRAATHVFLPE